MPAFFFTCFFVPALDAPLYGTLYIKYRVETTWRNPSCAHPGGESSAIAQKRGSAVVQRLLEKHPAEHIVLATHGNLMALVLQTFDPSVDFMFWKSLTMPDIYKLNISQSGKGLMQRLWQEVDA